MVVSVNQPYLSMSGYTKRLSLNQEKEYQLAGAELSSGGVNSGYEKVSDPKQFIDQEINLEGVKRYGNTDILNMQRLSFMSAKIADLRQIATDLQKEISLFRSSPLASASNFKVRAEDMLSNVENILNSNFNGQYVFSGTATSTLAVRDLTALPLPATNDPADASVYYTGNTDKLTFKASDTDTITTPLTAADQGIAELIQALRLSVSYNSGGDSDLRLAKANDFCLTAVNNIVTSESIIRQSVQTLDRVQTNLKESEQRLSSDIKEIGYSTQVEAMQDFFQSQNNLLLTKHITIQYYQSIRDLADRLR